MKFAAVDCTSSLPPFDQTVQLEHLSSTVVVSFVTFLEMTVIFGPRYMGGRECPLYINLVKQIGKIHSKSGGYNDVLIIRPSNQHQSSSHLRTESCREPFRCTRGSQCEKQLGIDSRRRNGRDIHSNTNAIRRTIFCL